MQWKRWTIAVLTLSLLLALAACGRPGRDRPDRGGQHHQPDRRDNFARRYPNHARKPRKSRWPERGSRGRHRLCPGICPRGRQLV
ncbi:MAG: hypothetical protein ACLUNZ_07625 [Evtepia sp.]